LLGKEDNPLESVFESASKWKVRSRLHPNVINPQNCIPTCIVMAFIYCVVSTKIFERRQDQKDLSGFIERVTKILLKKGIMKVKLAKRRILILQKQNSEKGKGDI
jgi:hypothetical protein